MIETYDTEQATVVVFWQEPKEGVPGEPAISMKAYSDCLSLVQGKGRSVNITRACVPEFIKAIKRAMA